MNSMEQSTYRKPNSSPAIQEIPGTNIDTQGSSPRSQQPATCPYLELDQPNPRPSSSCLLKIYLMCMNGQIKGLALETVATVGKYQNIPFNSANGFHYEDTCLLVTHTAGFS